MKLKTLLFALTAIIALTACSKDDPQPSKGVSSGKESEIYYNTLDRATRAFQNSDYDEAEKLIERAASLSPGLPMAYYMQGMMLSHRNKPLKAGKQFEKALKRSTLAEKERLISEIDSITGYFSDETVEAEFERGVNLLDKNKNNDAMIIFETLLAKFPYNVELLHNTGRAVSEKNSKKAIDYFEKALLIHPAHKASIESLITVYTELNLEKKLIPLLETAIEYYGERPELVQSLALNLLNRGDAEKALVLFENSIAKYPDIKENYFFAGKVYYSLNKKELSLKRLTTFVKKAKNDEEQLSSVSEANDIIDELKQKSL
ncbi:MAG: tetratricopeptide repeat protein [Spirochaetes bacterium]|jgi:tetratricopeptide (TPR) repeat protein|nr:tetratricopeptide repeat protein [Spirochaetota bacterium]